MSGRFADPRVGRDLLVGCLVGTLFGIMVIAPEVLGLNLPRQLPLIPDPAAVLRGVGGPIATTTTALLEGPFTVLLYSVSLVVWRVLLRRDWLVWVVTWIEAFLVATPNHNAHPLMDVFVAAIWAAVTLLLMIRYGFFLIAVTQSVMALIVGAVPSLDFSRWYVLPSVLALVIVAAIAAYGFKAALAGRPLFGQPLLEE